MVDVPGAAPPFGTTPVAINPAGAIAGGYFDGTFFASKLNQGK